jgi:hypothetical protein
MNRSHLVFGALTSVLAAGTAVVVVQAGPLDPPAGPIASSYKTLAEVEPRTQISQLPFTITAPGSYYIAKDLRVTGTTGGLTIGASEVTIDLNGFALVGAGAAQGNVPGIGVSAGQNRITIRNGHVNGWGGAGISLAGCTTISIENVTSTGNSRHGFELGTSATVRSCIATGNTLDGFNSTSNATFADCVARSNLNAGFRATDNVSFAHCTAELNGTAGQVHAGFDLGINASVQNCSAAGNRSGGFTLGNGGKVSGCSATINGRDGFRLGDGSQITNSAANRNLRNGIFAQQTVGANEVASVGVSVIGCSAHGNTTYGIAVGASAIVINNTSANNQSGFFFGDGCTVTGNTAAAFSVDGYAIPNGCIVTNNVARGPGVNTTTTGFNISGTDNRVESNNGVVSNVNFRVTGTGNFVIRNSASSGAQPGNDYAIAASNTAGNILNYTGVTITSTDPYINVRY